MSVRSEVSEGGLLGRTVLQIHSDEHETEPEEGEAYVCLAHGLHLAVLVRDEDGAPDALRAVLRGLPVEKKYVRIALAWQ